MESKVQIIQFQSSNLFENHSFKHIEYFLAILPLLAELNVFYGNMPLGKV